MKKQLTLGISSILLASFLVACQKPTEQNTPDTATTEQATDTATTTTPVTEQTQSHDHHDHDHDHDDKHDDKHDHDHDDHAHDHSHAGHDHDHAHDHAHSKGDAYQCTNNQTVHAVVHNHEGELEAHLTHQDITYDLNPDPQAKNRYTDDDNIYENDKRGMAVTFEEKRIVVTTLDGKETLLDCTKAS